MAGRHYAVRKAEQAVLNGHEEIYFYQYGLPLLPPITHQRTPPSYRSYLERFYTHTTAPKLAMALSNTPCRTR